MKMLQVAELPTSVGTIVSLRFLLPIVMAYFLYFIIFTFLVSHRQVGLHSLTFLITMRPLDLSVAAHAFLFLDPCRQNATV